jgi:ubiquinone/menaquinone biosynthesis C-methylase UbiE
MLAAPRNGKAAKPSRHNRQLRGQFSQQAESYSRLTGSLAGADRQAPFRALIGAAPEDLVLDVCCGPGTIALGLSAHVAHVTGLDLTPAMLAQARLAQARQSCRNIDWVEGDACHLPFEPGAFSLVTCGAAFHHMRDPRQALREMARVCRPGGRIVVRDVTPDAEKSAAYDRMEILRDPSHIHALTPAELAALGETLHLGTPQLHASVTADLPLDAILATSFPTSCSIADIRALFLADALAGKNDLGFSARLIDGDIRVSYPQTTAIWIKP